MKNLKLFMKVLLPVEFARTYTAVTDNKRKKTIAFTADGDIFDEIPHFLAPYIEGDWRKANIGDILPLSCDWETLMELLRKNREEYKILPDELFD